MSVSNLQQFKGAIRQNKFRKLAQWTVMVELVVFTFMSALCITMVWRLRDVIHIAKGVRLCLVSFFVEGLTMTTYLL